MIPNGWQQCVLPDFTHIVMGQSPPSTTYNRSGDGLPFFQGKAEFGDLYPTVNMYCSQPNKIAKRGATLLSVRAPVGPTNLAQQDCCIGRGLAAIHSCGGIAPKFLLYLFRSIEPEISGKGTGSTFKAITKGFVEGLHFELPPLPEQRRIVAKIEELFSKLDKGIESLKAARAKLNIYRQAVLKHAFEGKLTAQWREKNKDKLETPEQLLARIKQEREARYEQQLQEWKAAVKEWEEGGKSGKKPPKPKNLLPITVSPVHNHFWTRLSLNELAAEAVLGKMLDQEKNTGASRYYLGNINLRWGKFDFENLKTMKVEENEIQRYSLAKGDLVICEGGEPGRCAVWEGTDHTMLIQKALHRVRFTESYSPYFAYYFMIYTASSGLLSPNFTGSTIKHLTGKGLGNVLFPLCTLAEQNQIVHLLDRSFNLCDELDRQIEPEIRRSDALRQSILKKAFSGQLVPQDPDDEPASILLERIKAEKAARSQNNTRAKRRRTTATA